MPRIHNAALQSVSIRLAAADASKTLVAAPGAGKRLRIYRLVATIVTAAAQQIDVKSSGGAVVVASIPASASTPVIWESQNGLALTVNETLVAAPAAAGPAVQFLVEYAIEAA